MKQAHGAGPLCGALHNQYLEAMIRQFISKDNKISDDRLDRLNHHAACVSPSRPYSRPPARHPSQMHSSVPLCLTMTPA